MRVAIIGSREIGPFGTDDLIRHIPLNTSELVSGSEWASCAFNSQQQDCRLRRSCACFLGWPFTRHSIYIARLRRARQAFPYHLCPKRTAIADHNGPRGARPIMIFNTTTPYSRFDPGTVDGTMYKNVVTCRCNHL